MQVYKFFNSTVEDPRIYQATDFTDYFGSVLSTGFLHTDNEPGMRTAVVEGTLKTTVTAGKAIMQGHLYENTDIAELTHDLPEANADRIDRIVLRLNLENAERNILLHVIKGTPSGNPVVPTLRRDNFVYEISLARVMVRANTVQLLPADLVDERLNEDVGGLVHSLISIPTEQFQTQWDDFMESVQDEGFTPITVFAEYQADLASQEVGKGADIIGLPDPNSLFTATSVGGAMQELFTNVSDGKNLVGGAITDVDPNVVIPTDPTFQDLADGVGQISTGKKWASGSNSLSSGYLTVTGLEFVPSLIIATTQDAPSSRWAGIYSAHILPEFELTVSVGGSTKQLGITDIYPDGFRIRVISGISNELVDWVAYE